MKLDGCDLYGFCHTFGVEDSCLGGPVVSLAGPRSTTGYCLAAFQAAGMGVRCGLSRGVVGSGAQ